MKRTSPKCGNGASRANAVLGLLPLALLLILVVGVRLHHLDDFGLWEDEALGYHIALGNNDLMAWAGDPASGILAFPDEPLRLGSLEETHRLLSVLVPWSPVVYDLMHFTMGLGVRSPSLLRAWNILFALATAVGLWIMARRRLSIAATILALLLFALSGWDIAVSLQLKGYALAATSVVWSTLLLEMIVHREGGRARGLVVVGYGIVVGIGILGHYQILWAVPVHGAWLAVTSRFDWHHILTWIGGLAVTSLVVAPWMVTAGAQQFHHIDTEILKGNFDGMAAFPGKIVTLASDLFLPVPTGLGTATDGTIVTILAVLVILGAVGWVRRFGTVPLPASVFLGALAIACLSYLLAQSNQSLWARYLTPFLPLAWLTIAVAVENIARGLWSLGGRSSFAARGIIGPVALFVVSLPFLTAAARSSKVPVDRGNDWRSLTSILAHHVEPGDLLVHLPGHAAFLGFATYWDMQTYHLAPDLTPDGTLPSPAETSIAEADRNRPVWLILTWNARSREDTLREQTEDLGLVLADRIEVSEMTALRFEPPETKRFTSSGIPVRAIPEERASRTGRFATRGGGVQSISPRPLGVRAL